MRLAEFLVLLDKGKRRWRLVGTDRAGVVAGLDLEGRLFAVANGDVLNRVNPAACLGTCTREEYLNPGGDGLWPAPEGTCLGYEYATGNWRVPPGLSGARYWVVEEGKNTATIRAEIDLINARGLGVPTVFERRIAVSADGRSVTTTVTESIQYIGPSSLSASDCLLAPWTLAQFDCGDGCEVIFPEVPANTIRDLYTPSDCHRQLKDGIWHTRTDCSARYQIGLPASVPWIEFHAPERGLRVRRLAEPLPTGQNHIDIADRDPSEKPDGPPVHLSVYSDTAGFMEIEAAGGCPATITPGTQMAVTVVTTYRVF